MSPKFRHGANSHFSIIGQNGQTVDLSPYVKSFSISGPLLPGDLWDECVDPDDVLPAALNEEATEHALKDALEAAGVSEDRTPSHWQRIHRERSFEAEQQSTRARLARQWEPGVKESDLS